VLIVAEGSRTNITHLPRTNQFWLGRSGRRREHAPVPARRRARSARAARADGERPPTIRNLSDLPLIEGRDGRLAWATRDMRDMGSDKLVLAQDEMPPDTHNTDLHFHSAREEAWYVRSGSGIARLGEEGHPLRPGSFWLAHENTGVGHRVEVGPEGMQLVTMGDLIRATSASIPRSAPTSRPGDWSCPTDMHETPDDIAALQQLIDRSYASAGPHMLRIHDPSGG
jgi:mannose-6-phosphate isomerase-like protein (cupin superfamily)